MVRIDYFWMNLHGKLNKNEFEKNMTNSATENNNPFKPYRISHYYQFDQSISILRGWYFSFLFKF